MVVKALDNPLENIRWILAYKSGFYLLTHTSTPSTSTLTIDREDSGKLAALAQLQDVLQGEQVVALGCFATEISGTQQSHPFGSSPDEQIVNFEKQSKNL